MLVQLSVLGDSEGNDAPVSQKVDTDKVQVQPSMLGNSEVNHPPKTQTANAGRALI